MVQSLINPDLHYPEIDTVDPEDVGYAAQVCEMAFPPSDLITEEKFMLIAIGKIKYTFHDRGILYYPIYLLTMDKNKGKQLVAKAKIGVVEVPVKHALQILDEHKQIRLDLLDDPLLFAFATQDYLQQFSTNELPPSSNTTTTTTTTHDNNNDNNDDDDDDTSASVQKARQLISHGIFKKNNRIVLPPTIPEETETDSKVMTEAFQQSTHDDNKKTHASTMFWVQRFLKNDRYGFHTVHGTDSDSLFACICDAFQQIGQDTTVAKLRAVVALEATASYFKNQRETYEHLIHTIQEKQQQIVQLKKSWIEETDKNEKDCIDRKMTILVQDLAYDERLLQEFGGSNSEVTTLQHFRELIMTNRFYPDDWAIGVLEQKLHVKLIILSEQQFEDGDVHHVLHCPSTPSTIKQPDHYILLDHKKRGGGGGGKFYNLITYKNKADHDVGKRIFQFFELPFGLRHYIGRRCSEHSGYGFQDIQEFDDLASKHGRDDD
ncbi:hypothetical protein EBR57_07965, partial [bacterium]|nr:hypothetical protein [bacterium]